jgi:hypothetical protein
MAGKRAAAKAPAPTAVRHITHAGFSIPAAAKAADVPEGVMRRAVDRGEVEVIRFAGLRRVPPREVERLRKALGKDEQPPPRPPSP